MKENRGLGKSPTGVFARPHLITHSTTPNHGDWFASHKWDDSEWFPRPMKENRGLGKSPTGVFARPHLITHSTTPNHGDWFASHKWDDSEWFRLALDAGATPSNPTPPSPIGAEYHEQQCKDFDRHRSRLTDVRHHSTMWSAERKCTNIRGIRKRRRHRWSRCRHLRMERSWRRLNGICWWPRWSVCSV